MEQVNAQSIQEQVERLQAEYQNTRFADDEEGRKAKADFELLMQQLMKLSENLSAVAKDLKIDKTDD